MKSFKVPCILLFVVLSSCFKTDPAVLEMLKQIQSQNDALKSQVYLMQKTTDSLAKVLVSFNSNSVNQTKQLDSIKIQLQVVFSQISLLNTQLSSANTNISEISAKIIALQATCDQLLAMLNACCGAQVTISNGLVAYYPFSGNADDASGNGFHGAVF